MDFTMPMINFERLAARVADDEGFREDAYLDTENVWTVGYGTTRWANGEPVKEGDSMSEPEAKVYLLGELYQCLVSCQAMYPNFNSLDGVRKEVLVNMRYNLGALGLSRFKKMNAAVLSFDYGTWAQEMWDSKWYTQVGKRAERLRMAVLRGWW